MYSPRVDECSNCNSYMGSSFTFTPVGDPAPYPLGNPYTTTSSKAPTFSGEYQGEFGSIPKEAEEVRSESELHRAVLEALENPQDPSPTYECYACGFSGFKERSPKKDMCTTCYKEYDGNG